MVQKALVTLNCRCVGDADELAAAMAAAAEDTPPEAGQVNDASKFAAVVWDRFSLSLLDAQDKPHVMSNLCT